MAIEMTYGNFFLLSLFYFWASSTSLSLGIGYYTVYRPIIAGMVTGLILKDVQTGMQAGALINIIYIDFVSTGGSFKGDQCLTAIIAATAAILFSLDPIEAAAIAFPFGFLGILIWKYRLKINNIFVRIYEKKYRENKFSDICIYNGLLPQLLLYLMSFAVIVTAFFLMFLFCNLLIYSDKVTNILYYVGMTLVVFSAFNILFKLRNKKNFIIFASFFIVTILFSLRAYQLFIVLLILLSFISDYKIFAGYNNQKNRIIRKRDLVYSWFIWKNFSHSCYSYERLMGMAFAHSMKNIFKRLYSDRDTVRKAIHSHTEFFNTEPNMGTPIHGYIISLEEERKLKNESFEEGNISYIKKSMMGIAAGLGDSFTQVVLTPLYISMSLMLCLDGSYYLSLLPVALLALNIIFISYKGFMKGYYYGRDSLMERIKAVKNSKIKKYFPFMFSAILGSTMGNLLYPAVVENILTKIIIILVILLTFIVQTKRFPGPNSNL